MHHTQFLMITTLRNGCRCGVDMDHNIVPIMHRFWQMRLIRPKRVARSIVE